jgi:hypothetical protein
MNALARHGERHPDQLVMRAPRGFQQGWIPRIR